jgi:Holliday junction DNA helicase RuvB
MNDLTLIREKVNAAFEGFIANEEAVYSIKRSLIVALARAQDSQLPNMAKVFLLSGPPSVGKTELARRVTSVLGVPFVRLDGRGLRTREKLFEMIDDALLARKPPLRAQSNGDLAGTPILEYPPFAVFIDEIHLVSERTQEALLTLLEADDRTLLLDGERGRRIVAARSAAFVFATTKPADLDRAFRSRCIEIQLRKYTEAEVQAMVHQRFSRLPDSATATIAACSRMIPRVAFMMAGEVEEEIFLSDDGDIRACVRRVMHGRGIRYANGITLDDRRYLDLLQREGRPLGERAIQSQLGDIDPLRITDDIEPFLLLLGYVIVSAKGRQITSRGLAFLKEAREIQGVR